MLRHKSQPFRVSHSDTILRSTSHIKMRPNKPLRQLGQAVNTLPTYTIPEAAMFLAINESRLFEWYSGENPVLMASEYYRGVALLSFRDIEEAYKVYLLRSKYKFALQYLRNHKARITSLYTINEGYMARRTPERLEELG